MVGAQPQRDDEGERQDRTPEECGPDDDPDGQGQVADDDAGPTGRPAQLTASVNAATASSWCSAIAARSWSKRVISSSSGAPSGVPTSPRTGR